MNKIITPIGRIKSDFPEKFGLPRQSGMSGLFSEIEFVKEYQTERAFNGLDGYDYIWIIWGFDRAKPTSSLTVRPPRLGGNVRKGVFATRSPFRPNGLGLSSVKLEKIVRENGKVRLIVSGADMADGTPVYDVKPYLKFTDSHENAKGGFAEENLEYALKVEISDELKAKLPKEKLDGLIEVLTQDPRPSYQGDEREYGFTFCDKEVKFTVKSGTLTVTNII